MKKIKDFVRSETRFLIFKERRYEDKNGNPKSWDMVSRVNDTKAVMIVAYKEATMTEGRKLIITKEFRVPLDDYEWGMPAGLIDEGESIEETVKRELKEETGLDVSEILSVSPFTYNSAGMTDEAIAMAFVEVTGEPTQIGNESSEDIQTFLMSPGEVAKLLSNKENKFGAKGWIVMDRFARTGQII